jgi:hypothetical protein
LPASQLLDLLPSTGYDLLFGDGFFVGMGREMPSFKHPTAADSARKHFCIVLIKPSHFVDQQPL